MSEDRVTLRSNVRSLRAAPRSLALWLALLMYSAAIWVLAEWITDLPSTLSQVRGLVEDPAEFMRILRFEGESAGGFLLALNFLFNLAIVLVSFFGWLKAIRISWQLGSASKQAEIIDHDTAAIPSEIGRGVYRQSLTEKYSSNIQKSGVVYDLFVETLTRSFHERWEPPRQLAESALGEMVRGTGGLAVLQRIVLQLGILGTFLGMLFAFGSKAFLMESPDLNGLMESLRFAFGTSVFGLVGSIFLLSVSAHCRLSGQIVFRRLERMTNNILDVAKLFRNDPSYISDLSQVRAAVGDIKKDVEGIATGHVGIIDAINTAGQRLRAERDAFDVAFAENIRAQTDIVTSLQSTHRALNTEELSRAVQTAMSEGGKLAGEELQRSAEAAHHLSKLVARLAEDDAARLVVFRELQQTQNSISKRLAQIEARLAQMQGRRSGATFSSRFLRGWIDSFISRVRRWRGKQ